MEHTLKCWPEHYAAIERGAKTCELRLNDRPYQVGDALLLKEWEPLSVSYTGQSLRVRVTHILSGGVWLAPGYIAMSIRLMAEDGAQRVQEDFRAVADGQRAEIEGLRAAHHEQLATIERLTLALDDTPRVSSTQAQIATGADEETQAAAPAAHPAAHTRGAKRMVYND